MATGVQLLPVVGLGEIQPGTDLAGAIGAALDQQGTPLEDGDILVVTQKIVSKAEAAWSSWTRSSHLRWLENGPSAGPKTRAWSSWCCARADASCAWNGA